MGYFPIFLLTFAITGIVQMWLRNTYSKYTNVPNASGLTGQETARAILDANGLHDVAVEPVGGMLSDHYDPRKRVVRLSEANYSRPSVAGMAVAAHEVGHAIQHAKAYGPLEMRSSLVPVANIGNRFGMVLIIAGLFLGASGLGMLGVILFAGAVLFQVVTLPVEFDASKRALEQMNRMGLVTQQDSAGARSVLNAAAMTYVAAAATSIMWLLYYMSMFRRN
ncbi:MAG: zinc metallopeptidase [Deinococcota bacterium]